MLTNQGMSLSAMRVFLKSEKFTRTRIPRTLWTVEALHFLEVRLLISLVAFWKVIYFLHPQFSFFSFSFSKGFIGMPLHYSTFSCSHWFGLLNILYTSCVWNHKEFVSAHLVFLRSISQGPSISVELTLCLLFSQLSNISCCAPPFSWSLVFQPWELWLLPRS